MGITYKPIANRIVFEEVKATEYFGGTNIFRPDTVDEDVEVKTGQAKVVGPGLWEFGYFIKTTVKPGDKFLYNPMNALPFKHEGRELFVIDENSIYTLFEEEQLKEEDVF